MSQTHSIGVITCILARHAEEALGLARSIRLNSPGLPSVCVVEGELPNALHSALQKCYSEVMTLRPEHSQLGWQVKNVMIEYSPFEQTLFLDSDCLVLKDLRPAFATAGLRDVAFATKAEPVQEVGEFLYACINLSQLKKHFQVDWWPQILGGGHVFFRNTPEARKIFRRAFEWSEPDAISIFGWTDFSRRVSDELTLQMALAESGRVRSCALVEFPLICWTPWENARPDVFRRRTSVKDRTTGVRHWKSDYFVAHYGGDGLVKCAYRRELWRLLHASRLPGEKTQRLAMNMAKPVFHSSAYLYNKGERILRRSLAKIAHAS